MTTAPSLPTAVPLPFPPENCQRIASHLHRHDLTHLALTCKGLQPIAENHLYSGINLSKTTTSGANLQRYGPPIKDPWAVVHAIHRDRSKAQNVRDLRLTLLPSSWDPRSVCILGDVAEHLESLDLGIATGVWPTTMFDSFVSNWAVSIRAFPRLKKMTLPISVLRSCALDMILGLAPRLAALTLYHCPKSFVQPATKFEARTVPSTLAELEITGLFADDVAGLVELISATASTLIRLYIPPVQGTQHVSLEAVCWPTLVARVRSTENLTRLEVPQGLPWHWERGGFQSLRDLTLWREYDRCYVPSFGNTQIPPLPHLEMLHFMNYRRTGNHSCFYCQHTRYSIPESIEVVPVPPDLFSKLLEAPNLQSIEFHTVLPDDKASYYPETDQDLPTREVVETVRVRSAYDKNKRAMVWCKASTHVLLDREGQLMHLDRNVDQDWVCVGGIGVDLTSWGRWKELEVAWTQDARHREVDEEIWEAVSKTHAAEDTTGDVSHT